MKDDFQGDKKEGQSLLHGPEERLKKILLPLVPSWLETHHLTLTTVAWSLLIIFFSFLAQSDVRWLWGASVMIAAQYITDLLDGAIGRQRDTGLVKWGYYMDHFLDYIFLCSILIGYSLLVRDHYNYMLFFILAIFGAFMVNSFLAFAATNKFQISYLGIGPTEIRIVFIVVNAVLIMVADSQKVEAFIPYVLWLATFGLFITVYKTQEHIWDLDMRGKYGAGYLQTGQQKESIRSQEWSLYLSRRKVVRNIAFSFLIAFIALAVLMMRFMAPYHRWTALVIYLLSWIPFLYSFRNRHYLLVERGKQVKRIVFPALPYVIVALVLAVSAYVAHVLIPVEETRLLKMTDSDLRSELDEDLRQSAILSSNLESLFRWIDEKQILSRPLESLDENQRAETREAWRQFTDLSLQLDILKSKYKGFYQIDRMTKRQLHADAFSVQFAAFLAQYETTLKLVNMVDANPFMETFLNEKHPGKENSLPANSYTQVKNKLTNPEIMIRLNAWSCYLPLVKKDFSEQNQLADTLDQSVETIYRSIGARPSLLITNPRDLFEHKAFAAWFPFQKEIALQIGRVRDPTHEYAIDKKSIAEYIPELEPGDVILERRNWKMSNISIPGFWTHSALYTGTAETVDTYFEGLPVLHGQRPSEYIAKLYPAAWAKLKSEDENGHPHALIEALSPGVIFTSCEYSLNADYVAVLRPALSKSDKFTALCNALAQFGKPYDFNFDFATDRQLVCSELIFKAFRDFSGMSLPLCRINGRLMLTPNGFAKLFDEEYGTTEPQFEFVLFLDGNKSGSFVSKGIEDFRSSWQRPKWEILM